MKNGSTKHPCTCACIYHVPIAGISNCINLLSTINFHYIAQKIVSKMYHNGIFIKQLVM